MRRYFFLLVSIAVLLSLTLPSIISGNFTFVFDMGRDQLWTRNMVELKRPTLIGPWGSIAGVFFGPLWFYLLSIPYLIFNGDPRAAVLLPLVSNLAAMIIGWKILRKYNHPLAADFFAVLFGVSPAIVGLSSFAFHANLLPLATLLFFIGLFNFHQQPTTNNQQLLTGLPLSALMASLSFHLEPVAGVMLTGFLTLFILGRTHLLKLRVLVLAFFLFSLPFLPQLIFEFRHDFIQTKSLTAYFQGKNPSLMGELALDQRVTERITKLAGTLAHSLFPTEFTSGKWIIFSAFILLTVVFLKNKTKPNDDFSHYSLLFTLYFLLFHYFAYTFLFPAELKNWYLSGFIPLYILSMSLILENIKLKSRAHGALIIIFTVVIVSISINPVDRFFEIKKPMPPETLGAQMEVVDWIYTNAVAKSQPFAVYTYTPPVYDYHYEYLLWWRGTRKYNLLPAEFSYRPGETSYSQYKTEFMSKQWKPEDAKLIYLIIEPDSLEKRLTGWMGNFPKATQSETKEFPSKVKVLFGSI
ncbi:hypothetical protein HZB78_05205 [Candidatus Collierbacteria bacterium]|nr:hypothetical protein [Candidatus Collierbacteria bacterium]